MKKFLVLIALVLPTFAFAQFSPKNEIGINLLSSRSSLLAQGNILLGDRINSLNGLTYKRKLSDHWKFRSLLKYDWHHPFQNQSENCSDCGENRELRKSISTQLGIQYSYDFNTLSAFVYADAKYLRGKNEVSYENFAWGENVGNYVQKNQEIGPVLGFGVSFNIDNHTIITVEPGFSFIRTISQKTGVHNSQAYNEGNKISNSYNTKLINVLSISRQF